jgi:hydroxyacylglutathione hydrolase
LRAVYGYLLWIFARAVFTGDTLFIGDVGRTDLSGEEHWEELSGRMYDSLHEKVLTLGDHVIIYPRAQTGTD